jgi:hypothetical protein
VCFELWLSPKSSLSYLRLGLLSVMNSASSISARSSDLGSSFFRLYSIRLAESKD